MSRYYLYYEKLKRKMWDLNPCPHDGTVSSTKSNALPTELFRLTIVENQRQNNPLLVSQ